MPHASRDEIDRLIAAGDVNGARRALEMLWLESPGPAAAGFVVSRFEQLRGGLASTICRVAILRSFTLEPVVPLLRALAFIGGIDLDVHLSDFNSYAQEILDDSSGLYAWKPQVVILAVQMRDISPALWERFADLDSKQVQAEIERATSTLVALLTKFRDISTNHLIVHSLQTPSFPARGLLDSRILPGQADAIRQINDALHEAARAARNMYVLDYDALIARHGESTWHDPHKWLMARMPIAAGKLIHLAAEWLRFLHPITGRICKVLAVDLDNTLWGGVIGEDGIDGIKLDDNYPSAAYRDVQRALLDLYRRGILLAICSKNNPADVMAALDTHPGMLLKREHFAAIRINWANKADNLREIAVELNVGIDSIAFLDDNPIEREWIRAQVPEATVIEVPDDPMEFAQSIRKSPVFERLELTTADQMRGPAYAEQRQRTELRLNTNSLEEFYRSLEMRALVEPVTFQSLARAAQLTQKTNQFNLTTRRYNQEELAQILDLSPSSDSPGKSPPQDDLKRRCRALTIQVSDRFGDNGIVGVAILKFENSQCELDTFLLSCRVIGRTIETAFLAAIASEAAAAGATILTGWFIPTRKNAPSADFFLRHGFSRKGDENDAVLWELDLTKIVPSVPQWIEMQGIYS